MSELKAGPVLAPGQFWWPMRRDRPRREGTYLVYAPSADENKPFIHTAFWSRKNRRWEGLPECWAQAVTHWMPLPNGPEEE